MLRQNETTPFVRQCVNLWIAGTKLKEFTVSEVQTDLWEAHSGLLDLDLCKAISNELIRLETKHRLLSRRGIKGVDGCGLGRPPRVYRCRRHDEPVQKKVENKC